MTFGNFDESIIQLQLGEAFNCEEDIAESGS